jgi:hypothetical protein
MKPDIHLMCELQVTVNIHREECSLSDVASHSFSNIPTSSLFYSVSLNERKYQGTLEYQTKNKAAVLGRIELEI